MFHALASGNVVSIDIQNLFVSLEGEIKATGLIEPVGFVEEPGYFFAVPGKIRRDGLIVIVGLFEVGKELNGRPVGGIVVGQQNGFGDFLRVAVAAIVDQFLRVAKCGLYEFGNRLCAQVPSGGAGRYFVEGIEVVDIRGLVILLLRSLVSRRDEAIGDDEIFLPADDFLFCERFQTLRD